jgi:hypothetical protein
MKRSLALFGVLVFFCATLSGCAYYDDCNGGYRGHGQHWDSGYRHGGYSHGGYYRGSYSHPHHRDYCD